MLHMIAPYEDGYTEISLVPIVRKDNVLTSWQHAAITKTYL